MSLAEKYEEFKKRLDDYLSSLDPTYQKTQDEKEKPKMETPAEIRYRLRKMAHLRLMSRLRKRGANEQFEKSVYRAELATVEDRVKDELAKQMLERL